MEFDVFVMLCCIPCYFNYHVAHFSLAFLWSHVMCSKYHFRAMSCLVNVYCDRDISCIVILTYNLLISVQLMSYVMSVSFILISHSVTSFSTPSILYRL